MLKRMLFMLAVVAILLGSLGFVKFRQIQTAIAQGASFQPPPTAVTTTTAVKETWPSTLDVIGTVAAIQGVTVSADLPGTVAKIHFESGQWVHEGDILVELDTRQEQAQLAETEAQRDLAFRLLRSLLELPPHRRGKPSRRPVGAAGIKIPCYHDRPDAKSDLNNQPQAHRSGLESGRRRRGGPPRC